VTAARCGKPTLIVEFGGSTTPPGKDSFEWDGTSYGMKIRQFMASEEALAGYYVEVLPKLVEVVVIGAFALCFADYLPSLWDRLPCVESRHE
jgi:hypothetical protein